MARKAKEAKTPEIKEAVKAAPAPVEAKESTKPEVKAETKKAGKKPAAESDAELAKA